MISIPCSDTSFDFSISSERQNKKQKVVHDARTSTATGRWHLWTNGREKGNSLPHSSNIPLAGFISIPRARTFNACTLTFRIHLNMDAPMKITAIADPGGPAATCRYLPRDASSRSRQLAATCRKLLGARGKLRLLAATCRGIDTKSCRTASSGK